MNRNYSIEVANLSKKYRLGTIGMGSLKEDLNNLWEKSKKQKFGSVLQNIKSNKNLEKNEFWALKDINFTFKKGDVVGIVGANGSGKSTLLKILSRITEPTCGEVKIRGKVASLLEVGTGFHPELTGRENVYINGAILGMTKSEVDKKFDEIIDFSGVHDFVDTPVKRYSSGMSVRLGFAVAAHLDPEILIVDEVLAVGDLSFQNQCIKKMQSIADTGKTIFFVSHNNHLIRRLCEKGILLNNGFIIKKGSISDVLDHYLIEDSINTTDDGEVIWSLTSNELEDSRLRLCHVKIKEVGSNDNNKFIRIDQDFEVKIQYQNFVKNNRYLVSMHLLDESGNTLLTGCNLESYCIQKDPFCLTPIEIGMYETTCRFPGKLFNAGKYSVKLYIVTENLHDSIISGLKILDFQIIETDYMRDEYLGVNIGILKFKQNWSTRKVS